MQQQTTDPTRVGGVPQQQTTGTASCFFLFFLFFAGRSDTRRTNFQKKMFWQFVLLVSGRPAKKKKKIPQGRAGCPSNRPQAPLRENCIFHPVIISCLNAFMVPSYDHKNKRSITVRFTNIHFLGKVRRFSGVLRSCGAVQLLACAVHSVGESVRSIRCFVFGLFTCFPNNNLHLLLLNTPRALSAKIFWGVFCWEVWGRAFGCFLDGFERCHDP